MTAPIHTNSRKSRDGWLAHCGYGASSLLLALACATPALAQGGGTPKPPPHPCQTAPENHQFDFWVGQWDVTPWQAPAPTPQQKLGENEVHVLLEHCVISENWTGAGGGHGKSYNYWDPSLKHWRQIWIDESGGVLDYTGDYRDGAMRFLGWTNDAQGRRVEQRLTFFNVAPDTVRQLFETSKDGGKTWVPGFDGRYVRRR
jgi:hypothetical protein